MLAQHSPLQPLTQPLELLLQILQLAVVPRQCRLPLVPMSSDPHTPGFAYTMFFLQPKLYDIWSCSPPPRKVWGARPQIFIKLNLEHVPQGPPTLRKLPHLLGYDP